MTDFNEALQKWASMRYGEKAKIQSVDVEMEEMGYCDTCSYEKPVIKVIYTVDEKRRTDSIDDYAFNEFLQELVEAAQS